LRLRALGSPSICAGDGIRDILDILDILDPRLPGPWLHNVDSLHPGERRIARGAAL
jgi:hypothetical protein